MCIGQPSVPVASLRGVPIGRMAALCMRASAYRVRVTPAFQSNELGFRIVRTAQLPDNLSVDAPAPENTEPPKEEKPDE